MVIDSLDSLISCSWISIKDTKYQIKMILTLDVNQNSLPEFSIINDVYFYNNTVVVFKCLKLNIDFDENFCSYEVITPRINEVLIYHMLYSHIPNNASVLSNGSTCVTLRSAI
jgi:hypothetical protein